MSAYLVNLNTEALQRASQQLNLHIARAQRGEERAWDDATALVVRSYQDNLPDDLTGMEAHHLMCRVGECHGSQYIFPSHSLPALLRTVRDRLSPPPSGWQHIDTAPRGRVVLVTGLFRVRDEGQGRQYVTESYQVHTQDGSVWAHLQANPNTLPPLMWMDKPVPPTLLPEDYR